MVLSKPVSSALIDFVAFYLHSLYVHPIKTKSFTSCTIASLGNLTSQLVAGKGSKINKDSVLAYALFGFLFGGPIPHFFYTILEKIVPSSSQYATIKRLLIERFLYAPCYQRFSLYMLARFEGKTHEQACEQIDKVYWTVLQANWRYLSILHYLNLSFVPPTFRVLVVNLIGFFWTIFVATKRRQADPANKPTTSVTRR